jgi:hypothetical protein
MASLFNEALIFHDFFRLSLKNFAGSLSNNKKKITNNFASDVKGR